MMGRAGRFGIIVLWLGMIAAGGIPGAWAEEGHEDPTTEWMPKDVDFTQAEPLNIRFDDYSYEPSDVALKKDRPYVITFDNVGGLSHDFVNMPFFHAVVFDKVVTASGRVNTPHIHSLYLQSGRKMTLYLVPKKTGRYEVFCSIPGHRKEGMEGVFSIVD
ncbi:MAG: hypothetical protein HQL51_09450 [Magnetococcales bacterium]|nr:hypothetical protein [Magnetococcales bacterium]